MHPDFAVCVKNQVFPDVSLICMQTEKRSCVSVLVLMDIVLLSFTFFLKDSYMNWPRFRILPAELTASYSKLCFWTPYHPSMVKWRSSPQCVRYVQAVLPDFNAAIRIIVFNIMVIIEQELSLFSGTGRLFMISLFVVICT